MFGFSFKIQFEGIPTRDKWVELTTGDRVRHRGPELVAIDVALDHYYQSIHSHVVHYGGLKAAVTKMKIVTMQLCSILQVCEAWISAKSKAWELGMSSRGPLVRRLITNTLEALEVLDPHKAAYDPTDPTVYFRQVAADYRWHMLLPLIHNFSGPGRQLAPLNILEADSAVNPEHFLGAALAEKFSHQLASQTTDAQGEIKTAFNFSFDLLRQAKIDVARVLYLHQDHRWQHQIVIIDGYAWRVNEKGCPTFEKPTGMGELLISETTRKMYFLNHSVMSDQLREANEQRLNPEKVKRAFDEDMKARRSFDKLHSSELKSLRSRIYSEEDLDSIRALPATAHLTPRADEARPYQHQHSSFLAGEPCFFAGGLKFHWSDPGRIERIDNCSGHYQPKPQEIVKAIRFIQDNDANLDLESIGIDIGVTTMNGAGWSFGPAALDINAAEAMDDDIFQEQVMTVQRSVYEKIIRNYEGDIASIDWTAKTLAEAVALGVVPAEVAAELSTKFQEAPQKAKTRRPYSIRTDVNFF